MEPAPGVKWGRADLGSLHADLAAVPQVWRPYLIETRALPDLRRRWLRWSTLPDDRSEIGGALADLRVARGFTDGGPALGSMFVLQNAAAVVGVLALAFSGRSALRLRADATSVLVSEAGNVLAIAVGDPVEVAGPSTASTAATRDSIVEYASAMVEAVRQLERVPIRAAWSLIAATVSELLLAMGRATDDEDRAADMIDAVLASGSPLAIAPPRREALVVGGRRHLWSCRAICCLYYQASSSCPGVCPLVDDDQRHAEATAMIRATR